MLACPAPARPSTGRRNTLRRDQGEIRADWQVGCYGSGATIPGSGEEIRQRLIRVAEESFNLAGDFALAEGIGLMSCAGTVSA